MKKKRVVVAMSGGVDSSVAAALLKQDGFEVIGITMCFSGAGESDFGVNPIHSARKRPACCGIHGIEDARRVAHTLGIRHYVLNMQAEFQEKVIADFCQEYLKGRTPNPCVRCNQFIKFDALLKKALSFDAQFLATGHYARIVITHDRRQATHNYLLRKARDKKKDQSYFLYRLNQTQLKNILFPLAEYTKDEVRKLAKKFNLCVADKLASQEICFLPDVDYRAFLKTLLGEKIKPGEIIDGEGNRLGYHKGIPFYTIGQREGLGIALGKPMYVTNIDCQNNRIIVGEKKDAFGREFLVKQAHFILEPIKKKVAVKVRIRYNHKEAAATVIPSGNDLVVRFKEPQFAITPGQSAVFYTQDTVLGGGVIEQVLG